MIMMSYLRTAPEVKTVKRLSCKLSVPEHQVYLDMVNIINMVNMVNIVNIVNIVNKLSVPERQVYLEPGLSVSFPSTRGTS